MPINKLEGKSYLGIVVGGGDANPDPQKMGRVQVAFPQLMNPNIDTKQLPWLQLGSAPKDQGSTSFDRPPQEGTYVRVYFPEGSKSSGRGFVDFVYNGIHDASKFHGDVILNNMGWYKQALQTKPDINGIPDISQVSEQNESGTEKVTTQINNKPPLSMEDRNNIPSNLAFPSLVPTFDKITNIATGTSASDQTVSPNIESLLPGSIMSLAQVASNITGLPNDIASAMNKISSIAQQVTPLSGTNFLQMAGRVNPDVFMKNVENIFKDVKSFGDLDNAIRKIKTDPTITGMSEFGDIVVKVMGPFGEIFQKISPEGNITVEIPDAVKAVMDAFNLLMGGIQTATGPLLGNSKILSDMMNRLPMEAQQQFKQAVADNIPVKIGDAINKAKGFFG